VRLVIDELRSDVTKTRRDGTRGRLRVDYGDHRSPEAAPAWLWKFVVCRAAGYAEGPSRSLQRGEARPEVPGMIGRADPEHQRRRCGCTLLHRRGQADVEHRQWWRSRSFQTRCVAGLISALGGFRSTPISGHEQESCEPQCLLSQVVPNERLAGTARDARIRGGRAGAESRKGSLGSRGDRNSDLTASALRDLWRARTFMSPCGTR
jgi:hypothetical protein